MNKHKNISYSIVEIHRPLKFKVGDYISNIRVKYNNTTDKIPMAVYELETVITDNIDSSDKIKLNYTLSLSSPYCTSKIYSLVSKLYERKISKYREKVNPDALFTDITKELKKSSLSFNILSKIVCNYNILYKGTTEASNLELAIYSKEELIERIITNEIDFLDYYKTVHKRNKKHSRKSRQALFTGCLRYDIIKLIEKIELKSGSVKNREV
jgi:uncharacterized small protein (DUF1192 family)